jgi:hypothetical protein
MREHDKKKEREELYRNWMKWDMEEDAKEYLDFFGEKLNESIQKKLEEMSQAD